MVDKFTSPHFLPQFIDMYRELSCLWKVHSKEYFDRQKRNEAYSKLSELCTVVYLKADVAYVKQKISNLRTIFKKELNKIQDSKKSGAGADQVDVPRLWYFENLRFLMEQEEPRASVSSLDSSVSATNSGDEEDGTIEELVKSEIVLPIYCTKTKKVLHIFQPILTGYLTSESLRHSPGMTSPDRVSSRSIMVLGYVGGAGTSQKMMEHTATMNHKDLFGNKTQTVSSPAVNRPKKRKTTQQATGNFLLQATAALNQKRDECDDLGGLMAKKIRCMTEEQKQLLEPLLLQLLNKELRGELTTNTHLAEHKPTNNQPYQQHHPINQWPGPYQTQQDRPQGHWGHDYNYTSL